MLSLQKRIEVHKNKKRMHHIAKDYFNAYYTLRRQSLLIKQNNEIGEYYRPYLLFMRRVAKSFSSLDYESRKIINADYFYNEYPFWWERFYSVNTYQYLKKKAISDFIRNFAKV